MLTQIFGFIAAICTTVAFLPQLIHTIRTRDTHGVSLGMYLIFCTGLAFWFAYGIRINSMPITLANAVTMLLAGTILVMKVQALLTKRS